MKNTNTNTKSGETSLVSFFGLLHNFFNFCWEGQCGSHCVEVLQQSAIDLL